jgi:hypothetical protein
MDHCSGRVSHTDPQRSSHNRRRRKSRTLGWCRRSRRRTGRSASSRKCLHRRCIGSADHTRWSSRALCNCKLHRHRNSRLPRRLPPC